MWIANKHMKWMFNVDDIRGFYTYGENTRIMFRDGSVVDYNENTLILDVVTGLNHDSAVVNVGGDCYE